MTTALYQTVRDAGAWLPLSGRAKWKLSGADRVRYLNGQVTQDVRQADARRALYACVTNLKGKIEADIFIHAAPDGESLLLDADASLRQSLGLRLERYIIADDAVLEDVTEDWQLWHRIGPEAPGAAEGGHVITNSLRFALAGHDLWLPAGQPAPATGSVLSPEDAETLRVIRQVPAFPNELNSDTFPQEAGLETAAMSFSKGCYIGQEILSRIKTTGKMPRQMVAWTSESLLAAGAALTDADGRETGQITSAAASPEGTGSVGLAMVRQGRAAQASWRTAAGDEVIRA